MSASSHESAPPGLVSIRAADQFSEILVIDSDLSLKARGRGTLSERLPPGVYMARVQSGTATEERLFVVDKDRPPAPLEFPRLAFATPVPLDQTSRTHE